VRAPLRGWHSHVWNALGGRILSMSGRQLFTIDNFRDTGRPLLAVLADPKSIFMESLSRFKRRTLYANAVNDRSAPYYTTAVDKTDPYRDQERVKPNYVKGYEDVILDPHNPVSPCIPKREPTTLASIQEQGVTYVKNALFAMFLVVFVPVGVMALLVNSAVQTCRSSRRIRLHEAGLAGIKLDNYRMPFMINELQGAVENAYENLNSAHQEEYLESPDEEVEAGMDEGERRTLTLERKQSHPQWPTLALTSHQFEMIKAFDVLGWNKYTVWIHQVRQSHAAIIVRTEKPSFAEGHVVLKHWLNEEFLI
jgi:hypothetical protein